MITWLVRAWFSSTCLLCDLWTRAKITSVFYGTRTLTPALSHPMGEGESFSGRGRSQTLRLARITGGVIPSPVGWERVRVRGILLALRLSSGICFCTSDKEAPTSRSAALRPEIPGNPEARPWGGRAKSSRICVKIWQTSVTLFAVGEGSTRLGLLAPAGERGLHTLYTPAPAAVLTCPWL